MDGFKRLLTKKSIKKKKIRKEVEYDQFKTTISDQMFFTESSLYEIKTLITTEMLEVLEDFEIPKLIFSNKNSIKLVQSLLGYEPINEDITIDMIYKD